MTQDGIDFLLAIQERYNLLDLEIPEIVENLFAELFGAILRKEELECARLCAAMIFELRSYGLANEADAARWCELFGELMEVDV